MRQVLNDDRCLKPEIYAIISHLSTPRTEITTKQTPMKNNRIRVGNNMNGTKRRGTERNGTKEQRIIIHVII